ncbi:MAG: response regulator transcription factor [Cytophagales bacterium]|nr:response regulator transcription factor [Cytophagales bacterium]
MIKILYVDDHQLLQESVKKILGSDPEIDILGTASNGKELINLIKRNLEVEVIIIDIEMPEMSGDEVAVYVKKEYPHIKIVVLTQYDTMGYVRQLMEIGVDAYVLKKYGFDELLTAIHQVKNGNSYMGKDVQQLLLESLKSTNIVGEIKLTRREKEILPLIANGHTSLEISEMLFIAPTTVETHRRNLISKTGSRNTKELIKFAFEKGYFR